MSEYGTIEERMKVGIMEYVDPKGRKVVTYTKIMKKLKVSKSEVEDEALKQELVIPEVHFDEVVVESKRGRPKTAKEVKEPKGAKGRPKKSKKVLELNGEEEDLFANLVANASASVEEDVVEDEVVQQEVVAEVVQPEEVKVVSKKSKTAKPQDDEAKALKKQQDEEAKASKALKKQQDDEAKALKKQQDEEAKAAKKQQDEEAKAAKKQQDEEAKAAKALKKQQDEDAKKAAKSESKPVAKKAAKSEPKQVAKKAAKSEPKVEEPKAEEEGDVVKKIDFEGKKYLKSKKTGIVYDYNEYVSKGEQVVVGRWNEKTNKIDFESCESEAEASDNEESEDEYDE
jgi:hypothetical protein